MASTPDLQNRPARDTSATPVPLAASPAAATPAARQSPDYARLRADIVACAPFDVLADANEALAELDLRCADLPSLKPATAALLFGNEAAWRNALGRSAW